MARPSVSIQITARTLATGVAGGVVFALAGLPLPWLSGAAAVVAGTALAGVRLGVTRWLREGAIVTLGLLLGSTVTPETLALLPRWPVTLIGLAGAMLSIMTTGAMYLERVHGLDRATARLASMPGALNFVMALSLETSSDPRRVAIIQIIRMTTILLVLPFLVTLTGADAPVALVRPAVHGVSLWQLPLLGIGGAIGAAIFHRLKTPAPSLFGAMLAGAALYGPGLLDSAIPAWIVLPLYVALGSMIGANFAGADMALFVETAKAGLGSLAVSVLVALAWAFPLALVVGLPVVQVWLAYAPGGVETTSILAMSMGLDAAYVSSHHIARVIILNVTVPMWIAPFVRREAEEAAAAQPGQT